MIVVLGRRRGRDPRRAPTRPATFVNERGTAGQTSSMQCGLRAVPPEAEGVLFTLVDHPAVAPETIDALLVRARPHPRSACRATRDAAAIPIWFSRDLIAEFLALPEDGAARDVVRAHAAETEFLDVDDPGIVADIDDPEAYRALIGARA